MFAKIENLASSLKSTKFWDVIAPAPVNTMKGTFTPSLFKQHHRERRISVEVHRWVRRCSESKVKLEDINDSLEHEKVYIRLLVPAKYAAKRQQVATLKSKVAECTPNMNTIPGVGAIKAMQEGKDDNRYSNNAFEPLDEHAEEEKYEDVSFDESSSGDSKHGNKIKWVSKYKLDLEDFEINSVVKNMAVIRTTYGGKSRTRELIFSSEGEAEDFRSYITEHKKREDKRKKIKLKKALAGINLKDMNTQLDFLIEIVGGRDLPSSDFSSDSDAYVIVRFRNKEIHRTRVISSMDPIWTLRSKSLFIFSVTAEELFKEDDGMEFVIKDYDFAGKNDVLGAVYVSPKNIYLANEERIEYSLMPFLDGSKVVGGNEGTLAIRCRRATDYDKEFMKTFEEKGSSAFKKPLITPTITPKVGGFIKTVTENRKKTVIVDGKSLKLHRVRPGPDPKRANTTEWMSGEDIHREAMKPSLKWKDIGSGSLTSIYLEVISCNGLPNLDSPFLGNKSDAFVKVVFEDCISQTDIITDCLSPVWLPWSKRAFILHSLYNSSEILLGVFDSDPQGLVDHDLIGRVSIDLSKLRADTEYVLDYAIYDTANMSDRKHRGTITIRVRIEVNDERAVLLSSLNFPPPVYVNTDNRKDFRCVRATCDGKYDMNQYSLKTICSYLEEIMSYRNVVYYIVDALSSLVFWRGQYKLRIRVPRDPRKQSTTGSDDSSEINNVITFWERFTEEVVVWVPLHSLVAFLVGTKVVEHPNLLPSVSCGLVGWLLLAILGWRQNHPNPWSRCRTFREMLEMLLIGKSFPPENQITKNENKKAIEEFVLKWDKRIKEAEEARRIAQIKAEEEWEKQMEEVGDLDVDISTKKKKFSIDPLKFVLFPIQQYMAIACQVLRVSKNIVIWEECFFSFWFCFGSFLLAFVFYFVPWGFILLWTSRLIVWTLLGPWMKLVDIFLVSKPKTDKELEKEKVEHELEHERYVDALALDARINRENAVKLKDMKRYLFGKYITKVPILKADRFMDGPLTTSYSEPFNPEPYTLSELAMQEGGRGKVREDGQQLVGVMIPKIQTKSNSEAVIGQPIKRKSLLRIDQMDMNIPDDSTIGALMKLSSIVVLAGILTWYGVPIIAEGAAYLREISL